MTSESAEFLNAFLKSIHLLKYRASFLENGLTTPTDIFHLDEEDMDTIGIGVGHSDRATILDRAQEFSLERIKAKRFKDWIQDHELSSIEDYLRCHGLETIEDAAQIKLETIEEDIHSFSYAMTKRLDRAVSAARREAKLSEEAEKPAAFGHWGPLSSCPRASSDFLCVPADIASPHRPSHTMRLVFLVDSGSEVVTLQQDVIQQLSLPLIGHATSRGVHAAATDIPYYRALLKLGECELLVEVIGLDYNSVGVQVIRHFRHFITPERHLWLHKPHEGSTCGQEAAAAAVGGAQGTTPTPGHSAVSCGN